MNPGAGRVYKQSWGRGGGGGALSGRIDLVIPWFTTRCGCPQVGPMFRPTLHNQIPRPICFLLKRDRGYPGNLVFLACFLLMQEATAPKTNYDWGGGDPKQM